MSLSAADAAFDESRFVQPGAATLLACSICQHAPKVNATLLSCCGKSACAKCLTDWGQERLSASGVCCPFCRQFASVSKDRGYEDSLSLAVVRCKFAPCCRWEGPFDSAAAHEAAECLVGQLQAKLQDKDRALAAAWRDAEKNLAEADLEIRAIRAEARGLESDLAGKDLTISLLGERVKELEEALQARANESAQRSYMAQAMLACPPSVRDTMHNELKAELPPCPRPTSAALCMAGARARSRSPQRR